MLTSIWFKITTFVLLVIILIGLVFWGVTNAQKAARSRQVVKDVSALVSAFEYFKADQNRYPSIDDFANQNIMRNYINNFPPQEFANNICSKTYDYYSQSAQSYELRFCLQKSSNGFKAGWNTISK